MTPLSLGIFARVFPPGRPERVARDIAGAGYGLAHLNLSALGLPTMPTPRHWALIEPDAIRAAFRGAGVTIWGLSCSYNMIHPDAEVRRVGTNAAITLIRAARQFGVTTVTLCTGTRDPERMWAPHKDNVAPEAWVDMRRELDLLLGAAVGAEVVLGVEPEPGNVVRDADAAALLLRELGDDAALVRIVLDSANLLQSHDRGGHKALLERAFGLLGPAITCLHAKDLVPWSDTLSGRGIVDYELVSRLWDTLPQRPPVIVQDTTPEEAERAGRWLTAVFGCRPRPAHRPGRNSHAERW